MCSRQPPAFFSHDVQLDNARCGAFVTIRSQGQLRGCIGRFVGDQPLPQLIAAVAASAATQDPRFTNSRITPAELCDCHVEISVLSALERIADPLDFQIGVHGIYIRYGHHTGCFLPHVGSEAGWTPEQMLAECCTRKANLKADAWRNNDIEVFRFTADKFEEPLLVEKRQP